MNFTFVIAYLIALVSTQQPQRLPVLLPESYEIALARTAAPPELSSNADVYVLRRGGHVKVVNGSNGAACLVARDHPDSLYPICYDPEAARSVMLAEIYDNQLREQSLPDDTVRARVLRGFTEGKYPLPGKMAIAYMMSRHQVIYAGANGRRVGAWFPHIMIYQPGATYSSMALPVSQSGDLQIANEGTPNAHFVVMTRDWAATPTPLPPLGPSLRADPGWLCPGESFSLRYSGEQTPTHLRTSVESAAAPSVTPFDASHSFVANAVTTVEALAGNRVLAADTVTTHPERMEHNLVRPASCSGRLSLTSMAIPPTGSSERIKPRSVTNRGKESVTITHRGVTVRLAPGESTDAFNGVPFTGDWGVVVDTGDYNRFCPVQAVAPGTAVPAPQIDVLIVTSCT